MYKIIAAINSMISNQKRITNAVKQGSEIFFIYDDRFKWSITKTDEEDFLLYYYPNEESLNDLMAISQSTMWEHYNDYVRYSAKEIKTREAIESSSELYQVVQTRLYGIDEVLDSIINTAA